MLFTEAMPYTRLVYCAAWRERNKRLVVSNIISAHDVWAVLISCVPPVALDRPAMLMNDRIWIINAS